MIAAVIIPVFTVSILSVSLVDGVGGFIRLALKTTLHPNPLAGNVLQGPDVARPGCWKTRALQDPARRAWPGPMPLSPGTDIP